MHQRTIVRCSPSAPERQPAGRGSRLGANPRCRNTSSLSALGNPATTVAAAVGAVLLACSVQSPYAQELRRELPGATAIPERFSRQVAPTPSTYWRSPVLREGSRATA